MNTHHSLVSRDYNLSRQKRLNMIAIVTVLDAFNKTVGNYFPGTTLLEFYNKHHVQFEVHTICDTTLFKYLKELCYMKIVRKTLRKGFVVRYELVYPIEKVYARLGTIQVYPNIKKMKRVYKELTKEQYEKIAKRMMINWQMYKTKFEGENQCRQYLNLL